MPPRINLADRDNFANIMQEWTADQYGKCIAAYHAGTTSVADDEGMSVPPGWDNASLLEEMQRSMRS